MNAGLGAVTTAIVQAGVLLLHRSVDMGTGPNAGAPIELIETSIPLVDRESSAQEWAQQEPLGPDGWDRFDAHSEMPPSMLGTAVVREIETQAAAREVAQAVSVAAAYFEDSLQTAPEQLLVAGTLGAETLAEAWRERAGGSAGARDGGCRNDAGRSGDGECAARLAGRRPGSAEELMRISVNLANRPFVELRPLFAKLRLAMVVLALLAVGLGFALHSLNAKARVAQAQMDALKAKTQQLSAGAHGE